MKRILILFLMILCICGSVFSSSDFHLNVGLSPYGFQKCYFFYPDKNFINSKYAIGAEVGVSHFFGKAFLVSSDLMVSNYMYGNKVNEQIVTGSAKLGFEAKLKGNFGLMSAIGLGGSLCLFEGAPRLYLEIPVELGARYALDESSSLFLKVRDDVVLLFSQELRYSSLSLIVTPVLGYSRSI